MKTVEDIFNEQYGSLFSTQPAIRESLIECSRIISSIYAKQVAEQTLKDLASFKSGVECMFSESQQAYIRCANIKLP